MLRFEDIVFGPIRSRRLGASLGVNLLPAKGKLCNFDCIYCECGWNRDGHEDTRFPDFDDVRMALETRISELSATGQQLDSITFSGNGEPTLHPAFPDIIDLVLALRDRYYPEAKVSVLSNATLVTRPAIVEALKKVDNPILKIDGPDDRTIGMMNIPSGHYRLAEIIDGLKTFEGNFILQTMFLRSPHFDLSLKASLDAWMDIVRLLKPREIMVYTIDRETPDTSLRKYTVEEMTAFVRPLIDEGFKIQIRG